MQRLLSNENLFDTSPGQAKPARFSTSGSKHLSHVPWPFPNGLGRGVGVCHVKAKLWLKLNLLNVFEPKNWFQRSQNMFEKSVRVEREFEARVVQAKSLGLLIAFGQANVFQTNSDLPKIQIAHGLQCAMGKTTVL